MTAKRFRKLAGRARMENSHRSQRRLASMSLLTIDGGIEYQQNLNSRSIAIILIKSKSSRLQDLLTHVPAILNALTSAKRGQLIHIG